MRVAVVASITVVTIVLLMMAHSATCFQPLSSAVTAQSSADTTTSQKQLSKRIPVPSDRKLPRLLRTPSSFARLEEKYSLAKIMMATTTDSDHEPVAKKIIIAGAPASGKGTQCAVIQQRFHVVHLSTGDMLRAAVAAGTAVGQQAKDYMDNGMLVPDEVIIGIVKDRLAESDCQTRGWLLDGFPRTAAQARALEEAGVVADCFVFLNVPDNVLVERVVGRRTDPDTGKIYHMTFSPPENEEVEARLVQRSDDTEEKVKVRLEQFHANVDAIKDSYTDISFSVDGNQAPAVVSELICEAIESRCGGLIGSN